MKPSRWLLCATLAAASAIAAPVNYTMTFTGGISTNPNGGIIPLAPDSGSFTYDSSSGFSNFTILYLGETFNMTAAANAAGSPGSTFSLLIDDLTWTSDERTVGGVVVSTVELANKILATAPLFPGFSLGDLPRAGFYTVTAGSGGGPGPTPAPEPAASLLLLSGLGLLSFARFSRRKSLGNR